MPLSQMEKQLQPVHFVQMEVEDYKAERATVES
jgi:hypothetical protein